MAITFDPPKREKTLAERGLDFLDADKVFADAHLTIEDDRRDYGEVRCITTGRPDGRMVVAVWTQSGDDHHVFSMKKANAREQKAYGPGLG